MTMLDTVARLGGAETMALETCAGLATDGYRSYLCLTRWDPALQTVGPSADRLAALKDLGVEVLGLPRRGTADVRPWRRLLHFLRQERIDVIHSHMFGSNAWASVIGSLARTPAIVAHEHMWSFEGSAGRRWVDRHVIGRFADAFVAVSELARMRMIEVEGVPAEKVVLIRNGIPPLPKEDRAASRRVLGIGEDQIVLASVGLLRPEKAFDVLIAAAAKLALAHPSLVVLIAGEGPERESLERLTSELGLGETIRLLGYRRDVPALLAASDVCVCCSDYEGGPLSVMEYMAAGRPVIATRAGGLPELVEDGVTGLLIEPRDEGALAAAAQRLIGEPMLRDRFGAQGRVRAEQDLSLARAVTEVERLYLELI